MEFYDTYEELRVQPPRKPRHAARVDPAKAADIEARMAAMTVRSKCNEHDCKATVPGECDHPMHRQKVALTLEMLAMLGLPTEYPAYTEAEKRAWLGWLGQSGPPEAFDGIGLEDAA
jgi:hypothetical protein